MNSKKRELAHFNVLPRRDGASIPLSSTQRRLWFVSQFNPQSPAYNVPLAAKLSGSLDRDLLVETLNEIVRRHESLRTTFADNRGEPCQIIAPASDNGSASTRVALPLIDVTHMNEAAQEARAQTLVLAEARRPFDLVSGPLMRCTLIRLAADEHILVVVMHHIVTDGWSLGIFWKELGILYESFSDGQASPLPDPIQYADYAEWQRGWLSGERLEEHLAYWRQQLAGAPSLMELPTDRRRPATPSYEGKKKALLISNEAAAALRELSASQGATLFMTLLAAFKVLLCRYSGQTDIVVGTPVANRNRVEIEGIIGPLVNTLVMRTDLSGNPTFRELLRRVKETVVGAYAHQDLPFENLVEEISPERDPSRNPIFQTLCVLQNAPLKLIEFSGLKLRPQQIEHSISKFDVSLLANHRRGLKVALVYSNDLFNDATIDRMLGHLNSILENALVDPEQPILDIPLLAEAERDRLLVEWNQTQKEYSGDTSVQQLFAAQAERTPDGIAVSFSGHELSYAELNRRTNKLAHYLRRLGVGPETLVGVCVERSIEMIVGVLGVLKAGGAYLPLDASYPSGRLEFMLEDSQAAILLTQERLWKNLPPHPQPVYLDLDWQAIARESTENPASGASADNLAYVIYTSGSTGKPKGVLLEHQGLCNLAEAQVRMFDTGPGSRLLQFASLSFDASVSEIFVALLSGATLVLARKEELMPGPALPELIRRQGITKVTLPPTLLTTLDPQEASSLETVMSAGEACSADILRRWSLGRRFLNGYGPTEVTVAATTGIHTSESEGPNIGRPLPNKKTYILDERLQPAPVGAAGDLYVSGIGLARGYEKRPDLTAEKFIPDPFSSDDGARMYKTGDLARYLPDGQIDFIGRKDHQVKIGGNRIELGEIEAALNGHPAVQASVVVVREEPGVKLLAGYVVFAEPQSCTTGELKKYLRGRLPDFMVPSSLMVLESLPQLSNGKVNRQALPKPDRLRPEISQTYVPARTELEKILAPIWEAVLGLEKIGVHDNFFELGGNSLRAAILVNKLQQNLGEVVYIVALFDAPTIAELAGYLEKQHAKAVSQLLGVKPETLGASTGSAISNENLAEIRQLIPTLRPAAADNTVKNPQAVFILCPPRSGSTLLRVMLASHPALFAPPELELLSFNTLQDRKAALSGRFGFWLEGTIRAVMEIKRCNADEARAVIEESEEQGLTTQEFYYQMQQWIGDRRLVDKTPAYALDPEILCRSEVYFENTLYIHLVRHPYAVIRSFEDARLEQLFFRHEHRFTRRELAELVWTLSQENILAFLEGIPRQRRHRVIYEELVNDADRIIRGVCGFLGVDFHAEMLKPYAEKTRRMTDGIHPLSRMLGDVKFHEHSGIDRTMADRWRDIEDATPLGEVTWEIAEMLGYEREEIDKGNKIRGKGLAPARPLAPIGLAQRAVPADGLIANLDHLTDTEVDSLLTSILAGEQNI